MSASWLPRISFGMIVLNGEPFVRYNLRAIYPFAYEILVVEGACPSAAEVATPEGHSRDGTVERLRTFIETEDPEGKVRLVTAEDEGCCNGFWSEKDAMSAAFGKRASGDFLWQVDVDEFYLPAAMEAVCRMLVARPSITEVSFPMTTFWGSETVEVDGFFLRTFRPRRLFRWGHGYQYVRHRPPTVTNPDGRDLHALKPVHAGEMAVLGVKVLHYEMLFPKQVREKNRYYARATWTTALRRVEEWADSAYFRLCRPFRVHMVYQHRSWLRRYTGPCPPQIAAMMADVRAGNFPDVETRPMDDVERLLLSPWYLLQRTILEMLVPLDALRLASRALVRSILLATPFGQWLRRLRTHTREASVPALETKPHDRLAEAWRTPSIVVGQQRVTDNELRELREGHPTLPWRVLAEAVRATGESDHTILEVGCSTAYHSEVLATLLCRPIHYIGIDYSEAMIRAGKSRYPGVLLCAGDAAALPLASASVDVLISGCVILHVPRWRDAIREASRVSRRWVVFQRTPIRKGNTRVFTKDAYGVRCLEYHFGEAEFFQTITTAGLRLFRAFEISDGDTAWKTLVFEKKRHAG